MRLPSRELDVRSDLFFLGVIMYQCATGEHPFWNDELPRADPLGNILNLEAPNPHMFVPTLPGELSLVISKLLKGPRSTVPDTSEVAERSGCFPESFAIAGRRSPCAEVYHRLVESEPGFRVIPFNEFLDRMIVVRW